MPRLGVTYEEIVLEADGLVAKGENPTIEKVRRALGDRGSNSTISKYIHEWRKNSEFKELPIKNITPSATPVAKNEMHLSKLLENLQNENQRLNHCLLEKEQEFAAIRIEASENKLLAEERKQELQALQRLARLDKERIGRLEERLAQIKAEVELAKLQTNHY